MTSERLKQFFNDSTWSLTGVAIGLILEDMLVAISAVVVIVCYALVSAGDDVARQGEEETPRDATPRPDASPVRVPLPRALRRTETRRVDNAAIGRIDIR